MKKFAAAALLGILFLGSCAQKKEAREEYKENHDKMDRANNSGDDALSVEGKTPDSTMVSQDSAVVK